jgi:rhamnosyltransferase
MTTPPPTSISVIIPTYNARPWLDEQLALLRAQHLSPAEIIIIDSDSPDGTAARARELDATVISISRAAFNHGGTRNRAAAAATGDILVFMTQDALPADADYLAALTAPLRTGTCAAAYARQQAPHTASPLEQFARRYNYPPTPHTKTRADLPRMGVKTYFFSDAASAVRRDAFDAVGGFPDWVIANEDMVLCAKLLAAEQCVAYAAEAVVWHAHNYSLWKLFQRYFDIGVFMQQAAEVLPGARSGGEGVRFAVAQLRFLVQARRWGWVPRSLLESPLKFGAFHLGKRSRWLPRAVRRLLSGQKAFWQRHQAPPA